MSLFSRHEPKEDEALWKDSAYYWWYRFMQKVPDYGPAHPLWEEFGDVTQGFWDWWIKHELTFAPGLLPGVALLETEEDFETARKEGALFVRVDPNNTRHYLRFAFESFMQEMDIPDTPGRKKHTDEDRMAKRPFENRPEVRGLEKAFRVYELRTAESELSLYDIGVRLNLNPNARVKKGMTPKERADKINSMNATVSRYWRHAQSIIEHVAEGQFPVLASKKSSVKPR